MAFASSCSSADLSKRQFDVFVSFRGKDTRSSFTTYLLHFLKRKGIDAFFDEKLRRGKDLSVLFHRIEQSKMSIIVFSENFANSTWCLNELWKIMQRRAKFGHGVLPIFYKVKGFDIKNEEGSFEAQLQKLKEDGHDIGPWKEALKTASNVRSFVLTEERPEIEFVDKIVKETLRMLNDLYPCEISCLPGIESRSKELEELLMFEDANCVRTIGVLGMAKIGKTMVADSVYERNRHQFDGYCFLKDIDGESKRVGLDRLRDELVCKLLDEDVKGHGRLAKLLRNKKVLIVLDNVTDRNQIQELLGQQEEYKKGSRIVVTTRDKKLLQNYSDATYVVPRLNDSEAMELFCLNAFSDNLYPTEEFLELSNNFVYYAKGHPIALKLLGLDLRPKGKTEWIEKWESLRSKPDKEIQKALKMSYEELDVEQKSVFLDIACFFRSENADFVSSILKSDGVNAAAVMRELEDKCLVTISYNKVEMHDLVHAMGKEIGFEESIKKVGKRTRLRNHKDIRNVLEHRTGTEYVRGIFLNMSDVERIKLCPDAFTRMSKLKFLKIHSSHCSQWCDNNDCKFHFLEGLDHFSDELVYLHWQGYPHKYLPSEFNPEELVDLNLRYSHINQLWKDEKNTENLRWVDLSQSKDLLNLSGLSNAINLERLDLEGCTSLAVLGSSIEQMHKLIYLNLRGCTKLGSLPEGINLRSLKTLILSGCSSLQEFHIISENIESLYLEGSAIEQVVEHIGSLHNLILLNLKNCRRLKCLPKDLYKLKSLQELILSGCSTLESLPPIREEMGCLEILLMDGTSIKHTPERICLSNLKMFSICGSSFGDSTQLVLLPFSGSSRVSDLYLTKCNIEKLPENFSSLRSLRCLCLSGNNIDTLPESIEQLSSLLLLDLKHCRELNSLPVLPSNLLYLDAHGCVSLEKVAKPGKLPLVTERMQTTFVFTDCFKLNRAEKEAIVAQARLKSQLMARTSLQHNHKGIVLDPLVAVCFPGSDIPSWFCHTGLGSSIETDLRSHWCNSKLIGASLCVVVSFKDYQGDNANCLSVRCKCVFKNRYGQTISFTFCLGGWNESCGSSSCHEPRKLGSNHVFVSYNNCNVPTFGWSEESNVGNRCHPTRASLEFYVTDETEGNLECCKVLRCGMSLLYRPDENDRGFQGTRVTDIVPLQGRSNGHSQVEERRNGIIRDEI